MPGLSKVIVLDPDVRASRQVQLGFQREGVPVEVVVADPALELPGDDAGLLVIGGVDGQALEIVRRARAQLSQRQLDAPIVFAGRGVRRSEVEAAGADEVVLQPAYLRDVVTIGRLLRGVPSGQRDHLVGTLVEVTHVLGLVRAFAALGRSATLTLVRGLRRGEIRFYHGEVTSAQVGMIHGQAALHQLLLWTDARFDFHHEDVVRRQQIPLSHAELFADAERFLEGVRGSSGGLSPSVVLEQDVTRVQSLGKQIPTEVYGVLRMFDGRRMLADVLEDSPYRLFETLRVAQRAVDAGLLRAVDQQPARATWRSMTAIEEWLTGNEPREHTIDSGPMPVASEPAPEPARDAPTASRDSRTRSTRKPRRKKKRRVATPPAAPAAAPATAAKMGIDWGALVPRVVGAEVMPLSGVVPSAQQSGEIIATARSIVHDSSGLEPTIVFDEALAHEPAPAGQAPVAADVQADQRPTEPMPAMTDAQALTEPMPAVVGAEPHIPMEPMPAMTGADAHIPTEPMPAMTGADAQIPTEPMPAMTGADAHVPTEPMPAMTGADAHVPTEPMPAMTGADAHIPTEPMPAMTGADAHVPTEPVPAMTGADAQIPTEPMPAVSADAVGDIVTAETSGATTARIVAAPAAPEPALVAHDLATPEVSGPTTEQIAVPPVVDAATAAPIDAERTAPPLAAGDATPAAIDHEPSDGVIREHIATADTAPVRRRRLPSDPPEDDRPEVTSGEITMPRARPTVERRRSEPSILVADLAAVHSAVAEIASDQVTAPAVDAASASLAARVSELRDDTAAFSETEEAFFRAGHDKDAVIASPPTAESFDDLDQDYQRVGFWDRLRGKPPADAAAGAEAVEAEADEEPGKS
jgi:hypothetical protein